MTLSTVTVTWDELDIGQAALAGTITFALSGPLGDATDGLTVNAQPPRSYRFSSGTGSSDPLVANDNANLPAGSYYKITVSILGQQPYTFAAAVNHANGATQTVGYLLQNQLQPTGQFAAYLQLAGGTMTGPLVLAGDPTAALMAATKEYVDNSAGTGVVFPSGDTSGARDQAAITAAEAAAVAGTISGVKLWPGNFWVTGLTKQAKTYWSGAGIGATFLNLAAGADTDVIQGAGFSGLTLTGTAGWGTSGIYDFGISGMTIDGNASNQSGTSYGVRLYGYQWTFTDLAVRNCLTGGLWTEWGSLTSDAPITTEGSESTASNVRVSYNGGHGWAHLGPSDCRMNNVLLFHNNASAGVSGIGFWALSDQVSNVCLTASGMNGTNASGFTGTFTVQAAAMGNPTDLYASSGTLAVATSSTTATMTYTGKTATTFTGCTVTSGSGTFTTGNKVVTSGKSRFTSNGLQLSACHSWSNQHTWAAVFDSQVSETDSHWEGAQYGQLLVRSATNKSGGFCYDLSTIATGLGIQLGDNGSTPGVPQTAAITANSCDLRTRVSALLNDTAARSSLNWVSATQSSADLTVDTKTTGTYATTIASGSNGVDLSTFTGGSPGTLNVASTVQIPNGPGTLTVATSNGSQTATFTGTNGGSGAARTSGTQFLGVVAAGGTPGGSVMSTGGAVSLANIGSLGIGGSTDGNSRIRVQVQSSTTALSTGAGKVQQLGPQSADVGTASSGFLIKVNGTTYVNFNGSNKQLQLPNATEIDLWSDNFVTKTGTISGATGLASLAAYAASGLTGATAGGRYVGATSSGAPGSGTFLAGDFANDLTGHFYLCTAAGSPGTWVTLAPAVAQAHPAAFRPADPANTVSTSLVMMGVGATCAYTPAASGRVLVNVTAMNLTATAAANITQGAYYGTGTAPANGAAQSGTLFGGNAAQAIKINTVSAGQPVAYTDVLALTPGTPYWFDIGLATGNAPDAAVVKNIAMTFAELP